MTCRICGCKYKRTNWMARQELVDGYGWLTDTHLIACAKGHKTQTSAERNDAMKSPIEEDRPGKQPDSD